MVVLSEKGRKISIKTEAASSSMEPFEKQPVEHEEEASRRKYEVIGTDIEMTVTILALNCTYKHRTSGGVYSLAPLEIASIVL